MALVYVKPGNVLLEAAESCEVDALLVAPFVKVGAVRALFERLESRVPVRCVTRWRLEELATGVSDLEVWSLFSGREHCQLLLVDDLHAKYFRFDRRVYVGSANLTLKGLGWAVQSNLEAMVSVDFGELGVEPFEKAVLSGAVQVDQAMYEEFRSALELFALDRVPLAPEAADELSRLEAPVGESENGFPREGGLAPGDIWLPVCRSPEYVYEAYAHREPLLSVSAKQAALLDLAHLKVPTGLSERQFRLVVRGRLLASVLLRKIDDFLIVPRRFGEMRRWIAGQAAVTDPTLAWQTAMRWLLYFLPDRYSVDVANYSEVIRLHRAHDNS